MAQTVNEKNGLRHEDSELYKQEHMDKDAIWNAKEDESLDLDGKSVLAIIISALLVFGPVILVLIGLLYLSFQFIHV